MATKTAAKKPAAAPAPADVHKSGYAEPPPPRKDEFRHTRIAIVATRWNVEIVDALLTGAKECLRDWGVNAKLVAEFRAPGAFELPLAASALMKSGNYHGVIVLCAVIRGDTPHFDFVAGECSRGLRAHVRDPAGTWRSNQAFSSPNAGSARQRSR
jgi:6,7-dimethyl-8-ribityllumazine synthase